MQTMISILCLGCLALACLEAAGGEVTDGLAATALSSTDLGGHWTRRIEEIFDPQAKPPELFQVGTNFSRRQPLSAAEMQASVTRQNQQKRDFYSRTLADIGAEAQIILEYHDSGHQRYSVFIYRYKTAEDMDVIWKRSREKPELRVTTVAGEEVIYTIAGQVYVSGKIKASQSSVQVKEGRYQIMVSPGKPEPDDPGLSLARKQVDKIKKGTEHAAAQNGGPATRLGKSGVAVGAKTNTAPVSSLKSETILPAGTFNFAGIEVSDFLRFYAAISQAQLDTNRLGELRGRYIAFTNTNEVTRPEAIRLFDKALYDQAGIVATHPDAEHVVLRFRSSGDEK